MQLRRCDKCRVRVIPTSDNKCPNCGSSVDTSEIIVAERVPVEKPRPVDEPRGFTTWYLLLLGTLLSLIGAINIVLSFEMLKWPTPPPARNFQDPVVAQIVEFFTKLHQIQGTVPALSMYLLAFVGSAGMIVRRMWVLAMLAAVVAMIPFSLTVILGFPLGLITVIVLMLPSVRKQFRVPR